MWKLLKYDIKQSKRTMLIFLGILVFLMLIILLKSDDDAYPLYITTTIIMIIALIQFVPLYGTLFSSRCVHDHLIHYCGIKRKTIIIEPIVFLIITNVFFCLIIYINFYIFENMVHINTQPLYEFIKNGTERTIDIVPIFILSVASLWMFYGGVSLLVWAISSLIGFKGTDASNIVVLFGGLIIMKFITGIIANRIYCNLLLLAISVICMILYYAISMRQDRKYKSY